MLDDMQWPVISHESWHKRCISPSVDYNCNAMVILVKLTELWFRCNNNWVRWTNESIGSTVKLVKNTKLFVDLTNIMVVHIMNNEIGCFNQFVLREYSAHCKGPVPSKSLVSQFSVWMSERGSILCPAITSQVSKYDRETSNCIILLERGILIKRNIRTG